MPRILKNWMISEDFLRGYKPSYVRKLKKLFPVQAVSQRSAFEKANPRREVLGRRYYFEPQDLIEISPEEYERYQRREQSRLRKLQRRHEMPGRWRFEFTPNESGGGSRENEWDLDDGMYSEDTYRYFEAPSRRAGLEAMAVYGYRGGEPNFQDLPSGMKTILDEEGIDISSLSDEELEDFIEEYGESGPALIRVQQPDFKYDTRFKMPPERYWGPGVRPSVGYSRKKGYSPQMILKKDLPWSNF